MTSPITWIGTPNRRKGRDGFRPEAVVVHIMEGTLGAMSQSLLNSNSER